MSRKSITLEVGAAHESLMRRYAAFLEEDWHLAATAPEGSVLAVDEEAVVERGHSDVRLRSGLFQSQERPRRPT